MHIANDDDTSERSLIWVGRSDGSIVAVEIGDSHLTTFESKLQAQAKDDDKIQVSSQLVRQEDDAPLPMVDEDGEPVVDEDELRNSLRSPFEILHQIPPPRKAALYLISFIFPSIIYFGLRPLTPG